MRQIGMTEAEIVEFFSKHPRVAGLKEKEAIQEIVTDLLLANNRKISRDLIRLGVLMGSITSELRDPQSNV